MEWATMHTLSSPFAMGLEWSKNRLYLAKCPEHRVDHIARRRRQRSSSPRPRTCAPGWRQQFVFGRPALCGLDVVISQGRTASR